MLDLGDDSRIFRMEGGNLTETIDPHRFPPHFGCIARLL
jgi:hypothetical protein